MSQDEEEFRAFARARLERWRRAAYLLCHDWSSADDLVATAVARIYRHWRKVSTADNPDAYAQRMLTTVWLDEQRRPWRREQPVEHHLAGLVASDERFVDQISDRHQLMTWLAQLGPRQRAVVVLRFYFDRSVEETAALLGISEGTVKSQSARGIQTLRTLAMEGNP